VAPHGTFYVTSLLLYSAVYYLLAALTYGAFIPSGLFTVGLIFGGSFGRLFAELLYRMGLIDPTVPGIVGMYALLGAGEGWRRREPLACCWCDSCGGSVSTAPSPCALCSVLDLSQAAGMSASMDAHPGHTATCSTPCPCQCALLDLLSGPHCLLLLARHRQPPSWAASCACLPACASS
jgi:hypothetical protein